MNLNRPVIIGGSGSSGSTLLAAILGSHPEIICGPEMSFFNKQVIYDDYTRFQKMLPVWLKKGIPTNGYVLYSGFFRGREYYGVKDNQILDWANEARSLREFVMLFQSHILLKQGKVRFAEKTGSNAYCLQEFIKIFPECKIIHLVRDGRDVVCSLMKRGMTLFRASSHWMYNTSAAMACRDLPQYLEISYEDLVTHSTDVIKQVCDHIEVQFTPKMLERNPNELPQSGLQTWQSSPVGPITSDSVGQYKKRLNDFQLSCFYNVRLTDYAVRKLGKKETSCTVGILKLLGYSVPSSPHNGYPLRAVHEVFTDQWRRNKRSLRGGWGIRRPLTWIRRI